MPIPIQCDQCNSRFKVSEEAAGKVGKCPKCGNRIAVPSLEPPPVIVVTPEDVAAATKESGGNGLLVGGLIAGVSSAVLIVGVLILNNNSTSVSMAYSNNDPASVDQPNINPTIKTVVIEPALETTDPPEQTEVSSQPLSQPGFGLTLAQFKQDVSNGESWEVLSENTHEHGKVSYQLVNTSMKNVMLMVAGLPDNLREVSFTFSVTSDMNESDSLSRFAVMMYFLAKYSNWTEEELAKFWQRLLKVGTEGETHFKLQKQGHTFWVTPMGVEGGTFFVTGVSVDLESDAPTLEEWLTAHPAPTNVGLNKHTVRSGDVVNANFSYKGLRRKLGRGFIGEMTNSTTKNFQLASFKLSIYDTNAELVDTTAIVITNFGVGETRSFDAYVESVPPQFFYKIDFENGL